MDIGRALGNAIETRDICVFTVRKAVECALHKVRKKAMFVGNASSMDFFTVDVRSVHAIMISQSQGSKFLNPVISH